MQLNAFSDILSRDFDEVLKGASRIAVALSGGPDSMALCWLLDGWAKAAGIEVHALHVDHGLRPESAKEAKALCGMTKGLTQVKLTILRWEGVKPEAGIQEEARKARYELMREYCAAKHISALFLAHHLDDQAETVLFRLAKGSGLDGLSGMQAISALGDVVLCRPLLGVSKEDLIQVCEDVGLEYFNDPSNGLSKYARVRLRKSRAILEEEGLSSKRLGVTAMRLSRARNALDEIALKAFDDALLINDTKHFEFNLKSLRSVPEEVMLRVVLRALERLGPERDYAPRMEKIEALLDDLRDAKVFRKRTLGGVIFERDDTRNEGQGVIRLVQE